MLYIIWFKSHQRRFEVHNLFLKSDFCAKVCDYLTRGFSCQQFETFCGKLSNSLTLDPLESESSLLRSPIPELRLCPICELFWTPSSMRSLSKRRLTELFTRAIREIDFKSGRPQIPREHMYMVEKWQWTLVGRGRCPRNPAGFLKKRDPIYFGVHAATPLPVFHTPPATSKGQPHYRLFGFHYGSSSQSTSI